MNVPALNLGPIHHDTILLWINAELCTFGVNSKIFHSNISDLKEAKEQPYLFWYKWGDHIIDDIGKLVEELFTDKIDK